MAQDNMIMGDPPDLEDRSKRWFFILFILILLLALGGYLYFFTFQRESAPQIALNEAPKNSQIDSENNTNKFREIPSFGSDESFGKKNLLKSGSAVGSTPGFPLKSSLKQGNNGSKTESFSQTKIDPSAGVDKSNLPPSLTSHLSAILVFEYKSTEITPSARSVISEITNRLHGKKGRLILEGHTCSLGLKEVNVEMSEKRVKEVADLFRKMGLGMNIRMYKFYYGESRPISTNETPEGRALNRRVNVRFIPEE